MICIACSKADHTKASSFLSQNTYITDDGRTDRQHVRTIAKHGTAVLGFKGAEVGEVSRDGLCMYVHGSRSFSF